MESDLRTYTRDRNISLPRVWESLHSSTFLKLVFFGACIAAGVATFGAVAAVVGAGLVAQVIASALGAVVVPWAASFWVYQ